jgi:hypothetical protein
VDRDAIMESDKESLELSYKLDITRVGARES